LAIASEKFRVQNANFRGRAAQAVSILRRTPEIEADLPGHSA